MRSGAVSDKFAAQSWVKLKDKNFLANQRIAGKLAGGTLSLLERLVQDKTTRSLLELDKIAEDYIVDHGGTPTFKGYGSPPFPGSTCISINHELVHGVPNHRHLNEGDMVSFDLGVTINGAIGDTAITCVFGQATEEQERLIQATKECLQKGIAAVKVGAQIGAIGHAIYMCAKGYGYNVYDRYGGHGIEFNKPHAAPFVSNRANPNEGIRIQAGITIAIEPLLTRGSTETYVAEDGWTVVGKQLNAHTEHTIFVHEDHVEIMTDRGVN